MKVRMIGGIREMQFSDPLCGLRLEPVAFPIEVINYDAAEPDDPEWLTIHDEDGLKAWADSAFPDGYELWDMEVPVGAMLAPTTKERA